MKDQVLLHFFKSIPPDPGLFYETVVKDPSEVYHKAVLLNNCNISRSCCCLELSSMDAEGFRCHDLDVVCGNMKVLMKLSKGNCTFIWRN